MTATPSSGYFVRVRGRVQGPYELSRLRVLRARGQFSRVFEVSEDGHTWVSSESLAELLDPAAAPSAVEFSEPQQTTSPESHPFSTTTDPWDDGWAPRRRKRESNLGTILLILLLIVLPAGIIGGILLVQRLEQDRVAAEPERPIDPEPAGKATATFDYWSGFKNARGSFRVTESTPASQIARQFRSVAGDMTSLPTLGVDSDAVELVLDYSAALTHMAETIEQSNSADTYLEAFLRGADGDPFGKALEMKSSKDEAMRRLADVEQRSARVRARLTAAYGRQFP